MRRLGFEGVVVVLCAAAVAAACGSVSGSGNADGGGGGGNADGGGGGGPDGGEPVPCAQITDEFACLECSCDPVFEGCRAPEAPVTDCPDLGCPQPLCCQSDADCAGGGTTCAPPGTDPGCGVCFPDPGNCATDEDCTVAGEICEPI